MRERKRGTLRSGGSGKKVTSRKQAIAIGLSEARRAGGKVPCRGSARADARSADFEPFGPLLRIPRQGGRMAHAFVEAQRSSHRTSDRYRTPRPDLARGSACPRAVNSDHLTALGLVSMFFVGRGLCHLEPIPVGARRGRRVFLALNWFGDSLDGTLARVRGHQRPRYGFYVDHILDTFGALFVLGGLAISGHMTPIVAAGFLVAYYSCRSRSIWRPTASGRSRCRSGDGDRPSCASCSRSARSCCS